MSVALYGTGLYVINLQEENAKLRDMNSLHKKQNDALWSEIMNN